MKSVMISIKPKWCELIASGKKTVEVRKTRPKIETPFKCYIYCSKGDTYRLDGHRTNACKETFYVGEPLNNLSGGRYVGNVKVIGEFVCRLIEPIDTVINLKPTCLTIEEVNAYAKGKRIYAWHISDLVIYDEPKELSEFYKPCTDIYQYCQGCKHGLVQYPSDVETYEDISGCCFDTVCLNRITKPPQSWCYCEELEE